MLDKSTQKAQLPVSASQIAEKKISREIKKKIETNSKKRKNSNHFRKITLFLNPNCVVVFF
jgi:hypothetical protein